MEKKPKRNANTITWDIETGLAGTVPNQIRQLRNSLKKAVPPSKRDQEMASHFYRREITELVGILLFHLSSLD